MKLKSKPLILSVTKFLLHIQYKQLNLKNQKHEWFKNNFMELMI